MAMSVQERVAKASRQRSYNAAERRHLRYVQEIERLSPVHRTTIEAMAEVLRDLGYTVTGPDLPPVGSDRTSDIFA